MQRFNKVYFRRPNDDREDSLVVPAGSEIQHVRSGLITRVEPSGYAGWQLAARKMVGDACLALYSGANSGKTRHVAYAVPDWVAPLLDAVERNDENETKRIMHAVRIGAFTQV